MIDSTDTPPADAPRWQRRPDARRDELVAAAVEVFGEVGFAAAKLEDVARRAGVSKGTVYLYFESKEALFREMVRAKVLQHYTDEALAQVDGATARDRLINVIRRWWEVIRTPEMSRIARVIQAEIGNFPELAQFFVTEVVTRKRRVMSSIIEWGIERGEFRAVPNDMAARVLGAAIVHLALSQRAFAPHEPNPLSDEQIFTGIVDVVLNGIVAPPA